MSRLEFPENWDEMTTDEQNTFHNENSRAPNDWDKMTQGEKFDYFKDNCNCAKIVYDDIWSYLMENSTFKQSYHIINSSYNLRLKKIRNSLIHNTPIYKLFSIIFEGMEQYDPSSRHYYNKPCKCSFEDYDEWVGIDNSIERYYYDISCNTYISEDRMINACFITIMMNLSVENKIKEKVLQMIDISNKYANTLKQKLIEFNKESELSFIKYWKGSNYYYKRLFYSSIHLDSLNIPSRLLKQRYEWNFDAMICGHPKASNGWFAEGLKELEKYIILINS